MPQGVWNTKRDIFGGLVLQKTFPFFEKFMRSMAGAQAQISGMRNANANTIQNLGNNQMPNPNPQFDPNRGNGGGAGGGGAPQGQGGNGQPGGFGSNTTFNNPPPPKSAYTGGNAGKPNAGVDMMKQGWNANPQLDQPRWF